MTKAEEALVTIATDQRIIQAVQVVIDDNLKQDNPSNHSAPLAIVQALIRELWALN